jgi:6-pyruvoyltetrahydropterin/6-carboxytetrahydropterin synthase
MLITRRVEFSASHVCCLPDLSESENIALFGSEANPNGHGHNYVLEVTVQGDPDPITGMVMDLKKLKDVLEDEIVAPMDHRFLNKEVEPFDRVVPTAENVAQNIWARLAPVLDTSTTSLARIRLFQTADLYVDITRQEAFAGD